LTQRRCAGKSRTTWRERSGPPLGDAPKREGFGTTLIEQSLSEAKVERRFERDGFICTIKLMPHADPKGPTPS
jgi:two-component sensor histidine kinase